jgi:hypothetical protein
MKPFSRFLRIIVPLFFAAFIAVFVLYRSGSFDRQLMIKNPLPAAAIQPELTSENSILPAIVDSPPPASARIMSSSSKSGYVFDTSLVSLIHFKLDPSKKKLPDSVYINAKKQKKQGSLMSSSKSIVIMPETDNIKKDQQ